MHKIHLQKKNSAQKKIPRNNIAQNSSTKKKVHKKIQGKK